jgi:hypothetical protein
MPSSRRARLLLLYTALHLPLLALFYFVDPAETDAFLPCPWHAATSTDCPGCGIQRGVHQLLHGDAAAAFRANPLIVVILPLFLLAFYPWLLGEVIGFRVRQVRIPGVVVVLLLLLIFAFWIARNLPCYPYG